jgi:hypothetical protein
VLLRADPRAQRHVRESVTGSGDHVGMVDEQFSRAVLAYVGAPGRLEGTSPEDRVVEVVGDKAGLDLIPRIRHLLEDLHGAEPPLWAAYSVVEIAGRAEGWLRSQHPELSQEAIRALANQLAFDWK